MEKSGPLHDHQIKFRSLTFYIDITADAAPADIVYSPEVGGQVVIPRGEGQVAVADAIEDLSGDFTTAAAATGVFGLLLDSSKIGEIEKVHQVEVLAAGGTTVVAPAASDYLTSGGNIAIDINSDQNHTTTDETITLRVSYKIKTI